MPFPDLRARALLALLAAVTLGHSASGEARPKFDLLTAASSGGNADFYGGGDPWRESLAETRLRLREALRSVLRKVAVDELCRVPVPCARGEAESACSALVSLSAPERAFCRTFLEAHASEWQALNDDERTPLVVSPMPLTVRSAAGAVIPVAAMTERGPRGAVVFHQGRLEALTPRERLALLAHELGHKLALASGHVADDGAVGPFPRGRRLLDAVGAALAFHAETHTLPPQGPPPVPTSMRPGVFCAAPGDSATLFALGLEADAEAPVSAPEQAAKRRRRYHVLIASGAPTPMAARFLLAQEIVAGPAARRRTVDELFERYLRRRPLDDERELMTGRLEDGVGEELITASVLGSEEYGAAHGAKSALDFFPLAFRDLAGVEPGEALRRSLAARLPLADPAATALQLLRHVPEIHRPLLSEWYRRYLNRVPLADELRRHGERLRAGESWETVRSSILAEPEYLALQTARWPPCATSRETPSRGTAIRAITSIGEGGRR